MRNLKEEEVMWRGDGMFDWAGMLQCRKKETAGHAAPGAES